MAWESHVGILEEDQSYKINTVTVRYKISITENFIIKKIEDIGEVIDNDGQVIVVKLR